MAQFQGMVLTNQGLQLQARAQTGAQLQFTKVKLGDGTLASGQSLETMTELVHPVLALGIQSMDVIGDGTSRVRVVLTNNDLTTGFFVREIGVYAHDAQTNADVLYSVSNAGNMADFLPAGGAETIVEQVIDLITVVGNAQNVSATIDRHTMIATLDDVQAALDKITNLSHKGNLSGRNTLLSGQVDSNGNAAALYSGLTNGNITLKASTLLDFASGFNENGPLDYIEKISSDIQVTLSAADTNTVPGAYTADLCNGGTAISGGDNGANVAAGAFINDGSTTYWSSSQAATNQLGAAYIGYNFGSAKAIRKIKVQNFANAAGNMPSVKIQCSSNGATWTDVCTPTLDTTGNVINYINIPAVGAYQYWRLLANANIGANSWAVYEIEMYEALQTHYILADRAADGTLSLIAAKQKPRVQTAPSDYYTDNLCVGGAAISLGADYAPKELAFDGNSNTLYESITTPQMGVVAVGYDFGSSKHIRRMILSQGAVGSWGVSGVKIQRSTDNNTWTDVQTVNSLTTYNEIILPASIASRYWRILANSNATSRWDIYEITMHELAVDLHYYNPLTGIMQVANAGVWTQKSRVPVGEAVTDNAGKVVSYKTYDYGLINYLKVSELFAEKITAGDDGTAGKVDYFAMLTPPIGWLKANGASLSKTVYSKLFAAIGYTYGGNGDTFMLPDLRGEFIRCFDDGRGVDASRVLGSAQAGDLQSHQHHILVYPSGSSYSNADTVLIKNVSPFDSTATGSQLGSWTKNDITPTGGTETRPRNVALLACIKY